MIPKHTIGTTKAYHRKQEQLIRQLKSINRVSGPIAVSKRTSNLFRARKQSAAAKLNFKNLNKVIRIDTMQRVAEVEAATIYRDLVDATLAEGLIPAVIPQFTTITVGGAVSGGACEASSYKFGPVHETVTEMTILLSNGRVVTATPTNEHRDLFFALPNTFGSLGYILKLKIKLIPVKPFVRLRHLHFSDPAAYFAAISDIMHSQHYHDDPVDFLDGIIFDEHSLHITIAQFVDAAPYTSDYTYMGIYYKSVRERDEDYLSVRNFIWRWDADWAWGSKLFGMQNKLLRLLLGKFMLNSFNYWRLVKLDRRFGIMKKLQALKPPKQPQEPIVQDVEVPMAKAADYLTFFLKYFDLRPIWVCPLKSCQTEAFPFTGLDPMEHYINYGLWGSVTSDRSKPSNYFNRLLETSVRNFDGHKALYSTNFYPPDEFWRLFNKTQYDKLKIQYDPGHRLKDFYQKVCKEQL